MKIEDVAKQVFNIASKYEIDHNSNALKENLLEVAKLVEKEPTIYGSFSYSPVDQNQPIMGIFHEGSNCLSFTYGVDKLFVNYNGKSKTVDTKSIKTLPKYKPKFDLISETPQIKVEFASKDVPVAAKMEQCNCSECKKKRKHRHKH